MNIDRPALRTWLLTTFGNGTVVQCCTCSTLLSDSTVTIDRFPIPGYMGGTYTTDNIRPQCAPCNNHNAFTPTREQVEQYARDNGIALRDGLWSDSGPLTYSLAERFARKESA